MNIPKDVYVMQDDDGFLYLARNEKEIIASFDSDSGTWQKENKPWKLNYADAVILTYRKAEELRGNAYIDPDIFRV